MSLTASIPSSSISSAQVNILRLLIYYDIFNYPLTKEEIEIVHDHCGQDLNDLVKKGWIHQFGDFYSTRLDSRQVARRLEGNKKADEIMPKAIERAKFIFQFPFVRGVYISGSLSKGFLALNKNGEKGAYSIQKGFTYNAFDPERKEQLQSNHHYMTDIDTY